MRASRRRFRVVLVVLWALTTIPAGNLLADVGRTHEVLILHSYDPGMRYTRLQERGIRNVLAQFDSGAVIYRVEYLDLSSRTRNTEYLESLAEFYRLKFSSKHFDLIITTDTPAFDFLYEQGRNLFPNVPVVFSGVKESHPPIDRSPREVTGVMEKIDIDATIALGLKLHPNTKRIVAVNDQTGFGHWLRKLAEPAVEKLSPTHAVVWIEITRENIDAQISNLHPDDLLLFFALHDPRGRSMNHPDAMLTKLCRESPAPVYTLYDAYMGSGIVGGKLASGEALGRMAGQLAVRVLKGESAPQIPIMSQGANPYIFDHRALLRWNIPLDELPPDSIIKYREPTFLESYWEYVLGAVAAFVIQGLIIALLLVAKMNSRRVERLLRDERDLLQTVMNAAPSGILMVSPDAAITFASRRAEELFGLSHEAITARHFNAANWSFTDFQGAVVEAEKSPFERIIRSGEPVYDAELAIKKPDGSWWLALCSGIPIRNRLGKIINIVFSLEDVTHRHQNEQALRDAKLELESRVRARTAELLEANRALRKAIRERYRAELDSRHHQDELAHVQRLASMGEMATGLAHEINQPLAAIVSFTQGCIRRLEAKSINVEDLRGAMTEVSNQAHRAGEIIRRLRAFVRKEKPSTSFVHINDVVRNAATMIHSLAKSAVVDIVLDLGEDLKKVQADSIQLEQVILNVLRNGIDAVQTTRDGPRRITVTTRSADNNRIAIEVTDTGPGLAADAKSRVFEPFFTTKSLGMGMGLVISRSIIESHGGHMHFVEGNGAGATLRITLPKAYDFTPHRPDEAPATHPPARSPASTSA